jgi:hypothetical protein
MEVLVITILIVGISFLGIGINIFFRKDGKFPETEVGKNKRMHQLGIKCMKCEELNMYKELKKKMHSKINFATLKIDTTAKSS